MLSKYFGLGGRAESVSSERGGVAGAAIASRAMMESLEGRQLLASTGTGIDPANMGKGDWIWRVGSATANLGANTVLELAQTMKNAGFKWVIVKAGDGNDGPLLDYGDGTSSPTEGSWTQFNRELIDTFHSVGMKIMGYHFMYGGGSVSGRGTFSTPVIEQKVAKDILALGCDGLVIDAEGQLEAVANNGPIAENYCKAIRDAYPDTFLAYAPFPYVSLHGKYPYQAFSKWCDAVMPQDYYVTITRTKNSPERMIFDMNTEYKKLYDGFRAAGHPEYAIPIVPIGQAYNLSTRRVTESMMNRWFDTLTSDTSGTSPGGYNGTSFWSTQHHTPEMWRSLATHSVGAPGGIVDGKVFNDNNGDGIQSKGEANLLGYTVYSDANGNGQLDKGEVRTTTMADGTYRLFWLPAGGHTIRVVSPSGSWRLTTGNNEGVNVADDQVVAVGSFGATQNPQFAGTVYNDVNADGTRQADEPGLAGALVWVDYDGDGKLDKGEPKKLTKGNGRYVFTVPIGNYVVRQAPPAGYRGVAPNRGFQRVLVMTRGTTVDRKNFGDTSATLIRGLIFTDNNRNGVFDKGDDLGAPTTVWADLNLNGQYDALTEPTAAVGDDGVYRFTTLKAGTYQIRAETPSGWVRTRPSGSMYQVTLLSGGSVSKKDFGQYFVG
jgi:hypothetical protein